MMQGRLRHYLAEYADGALDPALRREIEALLARDPEARAEVARWQALRRAAGRAIAGEPVPGGLAERIRRGLRERSARRVPRLLRLGVVPLAAAAAVILAVTVWPQGASATSIEAAGFADVYRRCALTHKHDTFQVRNAAGEACPRALCRIRQKAAFACSVPNVAGCGRFRVEGACTCGPRGCDSHVVHVYFRSVDHPEQVVSVFAVDRRVKLCRKDGAHCPNCSTCRRCYDVASDGEVKLVSWQECGQSYVLVCQRMDERGLTELADGLRMARLDEIVAQHGTVVADAGEMADRAGR